MPEKRCLSDDERADLQRYAARSLGEPLRESLQPPERGFGEEQLRRALDLDDDERRLHKVSPHVRRLFDSISEDDAARFRRLLAIKPETILWINEKNDRELKSLDGAVEFINSSRTAARVLMWVCGTAVAFVGGVVALAKNGIDFFAIIRGGR